MTNTSSYIREMQVGDLDLVRSWRNHPNIRAYMYSQQEITSDEHKKWFEGCLNNNTSHLLIYVQENIPTGFINFSVSALGTLAEWGFYVTPDAPKGSGSRMGEAALNYAFNKLAINKVYGQVLSYNAASIALHKKLYFQEEGVLREHHFDGHKHYDIYCFGLLKTEWKK